MGPAKLVWDQSFAERRSVAPEVQEYPKVSKRLGEGGRALVEFRVSNDGTPVDIKIVHSSSNARLDDQALRILQGTQFARSRSLRPTKVFRETVAFCIDKCAQAERFVDSQGILLLYIVGCQRKSTILASKRRLTLLWNCRPELVERAAKLLDKIEPTPSSVVLLSHTLAHLHSSKKNVGENYERFWRHR